LRELPFHRRRTKRRRRRRRRAWVDAAVSNDRPEVAEAAVLGARLVATVGEVSCMPRPLSVLCG
jgi:hypothetical protein